MHIRWVLLAVLVSLLLGGCFSGANRPRPGAPEVSNAFLTRATAERWTLVAESCFYRLDENVDCLRLPKLGVESAFDFYNTQHFGSFHFSPVRQRIVAESVDRKKPGGDPHLVFYDLALETVWSDEKLVHFDIYSPYRWSPDGTLVSFAHGNEIRLFDVAKETYRTLAGDHATVVRDGQAYAAPAWSADSTRLVYETKDNQIAIVDIATGSTKRIGAGKVPAWSPDGTKIAFLEKSFRPQKSVFLHDVVSAKTETIFQTGFDFALIWSPDSRFLVFSEDRMNSIYGDLRVYDFEAAKVTTTGKQVATIRDAQIEILPESFTKRLAELDPKDNPNRRGK